MEHRAYDNTGGSHAGFSRQFVVCRRLQSVVDAIHNSTKPASAGLS